MASVGRCWEGEPLSGRARWRLAPFLQNRWVMAFFSKKTHEGELMVDHRASPGIPAARAEAMGLDPAAFREGAVTHMRTLGCCHCGGVWVENPLRTRPRNHCIKCDRYLCDACAAVTHESGYVHRSFEEFADLIRGGKFILAGGDLRRPILKRSDQGDG